MLSSENRKKLCSKDRKVKQKLQKHDIDVAVEQFKDKVKQGPQYVCCVCHRLLFKHQVLQCKKYQYTKKGSVVDSVANKCITSTYLHECSDSCDTDCTLRQSPSGKLWVCYTCHNKMYNGKIPEESVLNNLCLDPIPEELSNMNSLEYALHIPFYESISFTKRTERCSWSCNLCSI